MGWRTVIISNTAKLDYKMDYLVVRSSNQVSRIHLSEISLIVVETPSVSLTAYLLCELAANKIGIIFCDEKRYPNGQYVPFYGSHDTSEKIRKQYNWNLNSKMIIWKEVVTRKIIGQMNVLNKYNHISSGEKLKQYSYDVEIGDTTNREGHAAKVYFNSLFGKDFSRDDKENIINAQLNYGYSILLSTVCREIVKNGYITQIGIHHDNIFNSYNLACDLMEPLRPFIDLLILKLEHAALSTDIKQTILTFLNRKVSIMGREQYMLNAIEIYIKSILDAISSEDPNLIKFIEYEFTCYESDSIL